MGVGGRRQTPVVLPAPPPPERDLISTVHEADCARGPVRTNAENLALPGTLQPVAIAIPVHNHLPSHCVFVFIVGSWKLNLSDFF
jgi:hypothetical protein